MALPLSSPPTPTCSVAARPALWVSHPTWPGDRDVKTPRPHPRGLAGQPVHLPGCVAPQGPSPLGAPGPCSARNWGENQVPGLREEQVRGCEGTRPPSEGAPRWAAAMTAVTVICLVSPLKRWGPASRSQLCVCPRPTQTHSVLVTGLIPAVQSPRCRASRVGQALGHSHHLPESPRRGGSQFHVRSRLSVWRSRQRSRMGRGETGTLSGGGGSRGLAF